MLEEALKIQDIIHHYSFAGTALPLIKVGTLVGTIGKAGIASHLIRINEEPLSGICQTYLPPMKSLNLSTDEAVKQFLEKHIVLPPDMPDLEKLLSKLRGRRRTASYVVHYLAVDTKSGSTADRFRNAVAKSYTQTVNGLVDSLKNKCEDLGVAKAVKDLYLLSSFDGEIGVEVITLDADVLSIGLADIDTIESTVLTQNSPSYSGNNVVSQSRNLSPMKYTVRVLREPAALEACDKIAKAKGWSVQYIHNQDK
jgi:hypothetical protein